MGSQQSKPVGAIVPGEIWQSANKRAAWVPDHSATECMLCRSKFSTFFRRHHCRECGTIICGPCSARTKKAPGYGVEPVRVCDVCWRAAHGKRHSHNRNGNDNTVSPSSSSPSPSPVIVTDTPATNSSVSSSSTSASTAASASASAAADDTSVSVSSSSSATSPSRHFPSATSKSALSVQTTFGSLTAPIIITSVAPSTSSSSLSPVRSPTTSTAPIQFTKDGTTSATTAPPTGSMLAPPSSSSSGGTTSIPGSPSARDLSVQPLSACDLFNKLSAQRSHVVVDLRAPTDYQRGHIPRLSINIGMTSADLPSSSKPGGVTLAELEKRLSLSEKSRFTNRLRTTVILVGNEMKDDEMPAEALHVASLLKDEKRAYAIYVLTGGYTSYARKYPYTLCTSTAGQARHQHRPPFPWFPNEIIPDFLFLGDKVNAENKEHLQLMGIKHILNISTEVENLYPEDFNYLRLQLPDEESQKISSVFDECFAFLDHVSSLGERVLAHCHQGISRSATVVIAYVMRRQGLTLHRAYELVKSRRELAFPNYGFWLQLSRYEETLYRTPENPSFTTTLPKCVDMTMLARELAGKSPRGAAAATAAQEAAGVTLAADTTNTATTTTSATATT